MTASVAVPPELSGRGWEAGLDEISNRMNLEIRVAAGFLVHRPSKERTYATEN